ncbi:hypothetical protein GXW82_38995 [Streptacidiphilus sp. 4-A2]|nr:hypothetical protein [Streptacidiphilus sp. 4-A2]
MDQPAKHDADLVAADFGEPSTPGTAVPCWDGCCGWSTGTTSGGGHRAETFLRAGSTGITGRRPGRAVAEHGRAQSGGVRLPPGAGQAPEAQLRRTACRTAARPSSTGCWSAGSWPRPCASCGPSTARP